MNLRRKESETMTTKKTSKRRATRRQVAPVVHTLDFVVGRFLDAQESDEWFETDIEAEKAAKKMSQADENEAIAVWDAHCELQCVYLRNYRLVPSE